MNRLLRIMLLVVVLCASLPSQATQASKPDPHARQKRISTMSAQIWNKTRSEAAVQKYLKEQGLGLVGVPGVSTMDTSAQNFTLGTPSVYYDPSANQYYFITNWSWNSCGARQCWYNDITPSNYGSVGGPDAWGHQVDNSSVLFLDYQQLAAYDNNGKQTCVCDQRDSSSNNTGVVVATQDTYSTGPTYSTDHGTFTSWWRPTGTHATNVRIRSYASHTWATSAINSISVSTTGIAFGWTDSQKAWPSVGAQDAYTSF